MSIDAPSGPDWPRDAQELFVAFYEAATFHAGALQAARDYTEKFDASAGSASPLGAVADDFAVDAEILEGMLAELTETFARLSRRVRVVIEKARLDHLDNPAEVRRLKDRLRDLHREMYIECLERLGNGVDTAKEVANALRTNPEQTTRPEHLSELDDVIDEAEGILDGEASLESEFDDEAEDEEEDEDEEEGSLGV